MRGPPRLLIGQTQIGDQDLLPVALCLALLVDEGEASSTFREASQYLATDRGRIRAPGSCRSLCECHAGRHHFFLQTVISFA